MLTFLSSRLFVSTTLGIAAASALLPAGCSSDSAGDLASNAGGAAGLPATGGAAGAAGHPAGSGGLGAGGKAGSGASGKAGSGPGGAGAGGKNAGGAGGNGGGQAGSGQAGSGQAGSGNAGSGQAGSGQAGSGNAGSGNAGSGNAGAGGGATGAIDALIAAMEPGSWKEIPGSPMDAVCPPTGNHYLCEAVMSAWSGAAFDTVRDRLVVLGGGHGDSFDNNVFTFDLGTGVWKRWTELPQGLQLDPPAAVFLDKRVETCGLYPSTDMLTIPDAWLTATGYLPPEKCDDPSIVAQLDPQQPRSAHTYGNLAFSAATGRLYALGSIGIYPSGQSSTPRVMGFDFTTGQWVRGASNDAIGYGASATDAGGHVWYLGRDGTGLTEYDPGADTWASHQAAAQGFYYAGADIDRQRQRLVLTQDSAAVTVYDLTSPDAPAQLPATSGAGPAGGQAPGFAYLDSLDRFVAWSGGRTVRWLDPATWAWKTVEGTGDDPGAAATNGTFGRLRYSPNRKVLVAVSTIHTSVFLFKPPVAPP